MKIEQKIYEERVGWIQKYSSEKFPKDKAHLVLAFGSKQLLGQEKLFKSIKKNYPKADIIMTSTAGEIQGVSVKSDTIVTTAIYLEKSTTVPIQLNLSDYSSSLEIGKAVTKNLESKGLKHILVFSDGKIVNGSKLVEGINKGLRPEVIVTGGLAGDGDNFEETHVSLNGVTKTGNVIAIGFYGESLKIGFGSKGGWDEFGPQRKVTRSDGNVLYELDGKNVLDLYKLYLGPKAKELPGSALLFPISIIKEGENESLVRTILSINEKDKSITFAGYIPEGTTVRLMKANFDRLINAASQAAKICSEENGLQPEMVLLVSCVGRRLVLGPRTEEEVEAVEEIIGKRACYTGFYSYGEISPSKENNICDLHNQTLTLTTYLET